MRILLLDHSQYITAGLPKIIELAESLVERGHTVTLVATSISNRLRTDRFSRKGVEYILAPSLLWGRYRNGADLFWDTLNRIISLRDHSFDLVHAFDCRPTVITPALYLRARNRYHLILHWDDLFSAEGTIAERSGKVYRRTLGRLEGLFDTRFRTYADGHIVVSEYLRSKLLGMGVDGQRIMVDHFGSKYADMDILSIAEARQRTGIPHDRFVLAYAGSIFKGDESLLHDALSLLPGCVKESLIFLVVGTKLTLRYEDLGITVLRTARLPDSDFALHLAAADALILPYRTTIANMARWPSKFCDFCAMGRPIISTPISDLPLIYGKYHIGIMTPTDSEVELADSIRQVWEDQDKAKEMGTNARYYAQKELRLPAMAERIEVFYRMISNCHPQLMGHRGVPT